MPGTGLAVPLTSTVWHNQMVSAVIQLDTTCVNYLIQSYKMAVPSWAIQSAMAESAKEGR